MGNKPGAIIIEGHVQGLSNVRALGEADILVYVVDKTNCIARYSRFCQKFFKCPDFIKDDFADFLIDLAKNENIKDWVLIPSNDHAVVCINRNEKKLRQYYQFISPSILTLENIYDKSRLLALAESYNIPVPITYHFIKENIDFSKITYPVITKGRYGLSFYKTFHKKVFLSNNQLELSSTLRKISIDYAINETLTQELIPYNNTLSFTAFCEEGEIKTYWMGLKLREHPGRFGTATYAKSINEPECYKQSILLLDALKYTGVCEIEYLLDRRTGEYKLIEINPRTWLWVGLAKECGVDYARIIYNYVNKVDIKYPNDFKQEIYWINPITDFVYSMIGILKGELTLKSYLKSVKKKTMINALYKENDPKPGLVYLFHLLKIFKNR